MDKSYRAIYSNRLGPAYSQIAVALIESRAHKDFTGFILHEYEGKFSVVSAKEVRDRYLNTKFEMEI